MTTPKKTVRFTMELPLPCGHQLKTALDHDYTQDITPGNVRAAADSFCMVAQNWAAMAMQRHDCSLVSDENQNGLQPNKVAR